MSDVVDRAERGLVLAALAVATLGFGAVGLCGGYWTAVALPAMFAPGGGGAVMILIISLPSLIGGFLLARRCARGWVRRQARQASPPPREPGA